MSVFNPQKTVCPGKIRRGETAEVQICFEAAPACCPGGMDLVLAVDRSGSMGGDPLRKTVEAAVSMVETLRKGSCMCTKDPCCSCRDYFCGEMNMGLISFADCARLEVPLGNSGEAVVKALQALKAGGNTNQEAAFLLAGKMLREGKGEKKVLILFTDGPSNQGCPGSGAKKLQAEGVEIFCLGFNVEKKLLEAWASTPWETHVGVTCCLKNLQSLFLRTAGEILGTRTLRPEIVERVAEGFQIRKILQPHPGTVQLLDDRTLRWSMEEAGARGPETLCLRFEVCARTCGEGLQKINERITYRDLCHNCLVFPEPELEILPGSPCPPCPEPGEFPADPCVDVVMGKPVEACVGGLGRIVQVSAVIKNVCPGKALGVAVVLTEVDCHGKEQNRGMKVYEIPAQEGEGCRDVTLDCLQFVVPEPKCPCSCPSLCEKRYFRARVLANYLDTDFTCCDGSTSLSD